MSCFVKQFDETMLGMLPHPEEPHQIVGRLIPQYNGKEWLLSEELLDVPREKTYPMDEYDPTIYVNNPDKAAFLAMVNGKCIGSLRICKWWNKNAFVEDIAVDREHRGCGIGTKLMDEAVRWCLGNNLHGIALETQDWNLLACRFYLKYGFKLGGLDVYLYDAFKATSQEIALYFYLLA